jgi:hypothetical protein
MIYLKIIRKRECVVSKIRSVHYDVITMCFSVGKHKYNIICYSLIPAQKIQYSIEDTYPWR